MAHWIGIGPRIGNAKDRELDRDVRIGGSCKQAINSEPVVGEIGIFQQLGFRGASRRAIL